MSHSVSTRELSNFLVVAKDGNVGYLDDFYLDDANWIIRHMMVESGEWLCRKDVVIANQAVERVDLSSRRIFLNVTRGQIERDSQIIQLTQLHKIKEFIGMGIHTSESTFGKISDILFATEKWTVEHLVAFTHKVLNRKAVLISPKDVISTDWIHHRVDVKLTEEQIQNAPEWVR